MENTLSPCDIDDSEPYVDEAAEDLEKFSYEIPRNEFYEKCPQHHESIHVDGCAPVLGFNPNLNSIEIKQSKAYYRAMIQQKHAYTQQRRYSKNVEQLYYLHGKLFDAISEKYKDFLPPSSFKTKAYDYLIQLVRSSQCKESVNSIGGRQIYAMAAYIIAAETEYSNFDEDAGRAILNDRFNVMKEGLKLRDLGIKSDDELLFNREQIELVHTLAIESNGRAGEFYDLLARNEIEYDRTKQETFSKYKMNEALTKLRVIISKQFKNVINNPEKQKAIQNHIIETFRNRFYIATRNYIFSHTFPNDLGVAMLNTAKRICNYITAQGTLPHKNNVLVPSIVRIAYLMNCDDSFRVSVCGDDSIIKPNSFVLFSVKTAMYTLSSEIIAKIGMRLCDDTIGKQIVQKYPERVIHQLCVAHDTSFTRAYVKQNFGEISTDLLVQSMKLPNQGTNIIKTEIDHRGISKFTIRNRNGQRFFTAIYAPCDGTKFTNQHSIAESEFRNVILRLLTKEGSFRELGKELNLSMNRQQAACSLLKYVNAIEQKSRKYHITLSVDELSRVLNKTFRMKLTEDRELNAKYITTCGTIKPAESVIEYTCRFDKYHRLSFIIKRSKQRNDTNIVQIPTIEQVLEFIYTAQAGNVANIVQCVKINATIVTEILQFLSYLRIIQLNNGDWILATKCGSVQQIATIINTAFQSYAK